MNNKYLFALAIAVTGVAAAWYFSKPPAMAPLPVPATSSAVKTVAPAGVDPAPENTAMATAVSSVAAQQVIPETLQERLDAIAIRRPELQLDVETVQTKIAQPIAWTPSEKIPQHLPLTAEELNDGRQFIALDDLKIETLMPGDSVDIQMPDTKNTFEVVIDKVEKHDYNSISWYGHIEGADGQDYSVSFTRGASLTVAGFDTPDGHYVLQGHGKDGWIASSGLLYKQDTSVTDAIYPEDVLDAHEH
ncbi:hypothetical protein [Cellvibrio japonicus]|nr:hypothetical protein [Cellvibrio japonicus]QEI11005.1 hypothetical protein FY117_01345 [Cellvibrio japonicus]QEI14580.1 hypothetical protein FY116_01345 [Cellvibrio japonicus]QEI18159.1 hypothetical protein FY115_01345 [Cellvibrio japonicus]